MDPFPEHPSGAVLPRLAAPPRRVPFTVAARLLFGGFGVFAWIWLGFGSSMAAAFLRHADLASWVLLAGPLVTVPGRVTGCEATHFSEGGSKGRRGTPIYANRYRFGPEADEREGVSYALGACVPAGTTVAVEHPPGRPDRSRIQGMRRAEFGPAILFVTLFPIAGIAMVLFTLRAGRRQLRLLARGRVTLGRLVAQEATNTKINGRRVQRLRFAIQPDAGPACEVELRTHLPEKALDDPRERILYDPSRPSDAVAWDLLPGGGRLDARGELQPAGLVGALLVLLPPALAVLGHLVALGIVSFGPT